MSEHIYAMRVMVRGHIWQGHTCSYEHTLTCFDEASLAENVQQYTSRERGYGHLLSMFPEFSDLTWLRIECSHRWAENHDGRRREIVETWPVAGRGLAPMRKAYEVRRQLEAA